MTVYYSKGHTSSGSPLAFETPANWNTEDDATGSDATSLAGHHLIVQASHFMTLGADVPCGSVRLLGTLTGNDNTITTDRATSNKPFDHDGTISGDLNVTITNTGVQADGWMIDSGHGNTGNINDLTINMANGTTANKTIGIAETCTLDGDLIITSGTFDTVFSGGSSQTLTVDGDCYVAGTLTGNASAISLGSLEVAASGKYNATTGTTTITAKDSVTGYSWDVNGTDSFDNNDGTVLFDLGSGVDTHVRTGQSDGANSFHHLTVLLNASTNTLNMRPNAGTVMTVEGNLTVQEGILQKNTHSHTLTVTGHVSIESGGKIDATSASGVNNFGSLTIAGSAEYIATSGTTTLTINNGSGYIMQSAGTSRFTHSNGTVKFDGSESLPSVDVDDPFYNVIIDTNNKLRLIDQKLDIANDLTITSGGAFAHSSTPNTAIEVGGNVDIQGGTLGSTDCTANWKFNSLTIGNGTTYIAPSGTTEITGEGDGTSGTNGYAWYNVSGTYTHNNGTVKFTGGSDTDIREDAFYNLIINGDTSSVDYYIRQKDGESSSSGHVRILNNLDIQRGGFSRSKSANELTVFGTLDICSGGTGGYFGDTSDTGIYNLGTVNIHNNGTFNLSNGANNVNSIRNIGGAVAQD